MRAFHPTDGLYAAFVTLSPSPPGLSTAPRQVALFGAGYVGTALARVLLERGQRVIALTRNPERAAELSAAGARVVVADLASPAWHGEIGTVDGVVNCVSSGGGGPDGYRHSYVEGARSILTWLARVGPPEALVYTSSTSVYPQHGGVVDEDSPTDAAVGNALFLLEAERLMAGAPASGRARRACILRLAGIYGPGRHHLLDQLRVGTMAFPGRGDHRLNLAHRDDIVAALLLALEQGPDGATTLNVADDAPTPKAEVVAWLAARLGVPAPVFSGVTMPGRRAETPDRTVCNRRIKQVLGWRPRYPDFRAGYEAILGA